MDASCESLVVSQCRERPSVFRLRFFSRSTYDETQFCFLAGQLREIHQHPPKAVISKTALQYQNLDSNFQASLRFSIKDSACGRKGN